MKQVSQRQSDRQSSLKILPHTADEENELRINKAFLSEHLDQSDEALTSRNRFCRALNC